MQIYFLNMWYGPAVTPWLQGNSKFVWVKRQRLQLWKFFFANSREDVLDSEFKQESFMFKLTGFRSCGLWIEIQPRCQQCWLQRPPVASLWTASSMGSPWPTSAVGSRAAGGDAWLNRPPGGDCCPWPLRWGLSGGQLRVVPASWGSVRASKDRRRSLGRHPGDNTPPRVFLLFGCVSYLEQQQRCSEVVEYVEVFRDSGAVQRQPIRRQ